MFHYRNHGAAQGRALVGIQVPSSERKKFNHFLKNVGYDYADESDNPVYRMFLA